MSDEQRETLRYIFAGNVQGVGFRYTTSQLARQFPVRGFVRNLANGNVELKVTGESEFVRRFIDAVQGEFAGNITTFDLERSYPDDLPDGFEIW